jgi:regulator of protease activity HflC (stomatin/prohibitin superfamily)
VLTRRYGREIPASRQAEGDFLAGDGERGIVAEVLKPGRHRINPYAYTVEVVSAVEIHADEVGVRTLRVGADPRKLDPAKHKSPYTVPVGTRGVQDRFVSSGVHYLNPYVEEIVPVNVANRRVEFRDIVFPSRDGFPLTPHVLVTYKVVPAQAPDLLVMICDQGRLHQGPDDAEHNEILQKIIYPLVRGYVRIEGSKFDARDFIAAATGPQGAAAINPRERLQEEVLNKVQPSCQELGITIESVTIDQMEVPGELAAVIAEREQARVTREKNTETIGQYKEQQELKAKEGLTQQQTEKVAAETRLSLATTMAKQRKAVEESRLKQELTAAQLRLDAAREQAKAVYSRGKAEADVITLNNEAETSGLRKAVAGFPNVETFAQYQVLLKLAPALGEIFASDGSDFAKLVSAMIAPPTKTSTSGAATAAAALPLKGK